MSSKRCCVPRCVETEDSNRILHWFPNPEKDIDRFRMWVHAIGGEILGLNNEDIYKLRRVCHAHFEEKYCCRYNKISNIAVPTLHMPGLSTSKFIYTNRLPFREVGNLPSTSIGQLPEFTSESEKPIQEIKCLSQDNGILPVECKETADILLFFYNLFDSVNGSFSKNRFSKPLLGPVTPNSIHHEVWTESKKVLKTMKFITDKNKIANVPSINNWVWTLKGMETLVKILATDHNITSLWMRHLNQDPIENFFGAIRSHGCRNTNPTPERFESALTTLLVNSLSSVHAPGANCEEDQCNALHALVVTKHNEVAATGDIPLDIINEIKLTPLEEKSQPQILGTIQYVSGYFLKKSKNKIFRSCETCKSNLFCEIENDFIITAGNMPIVVGLLVRT